MGWQLGVCVRAQRGKEMKKGKKLLFEDIPEHISERVYSDIGQASMCWENPEKAGVFDDQQAAEIGLGLCQFIIREKNGSF